jgi:hypothetical protein
MIAILTLAGYITILIIIAYVYRKQEKAVMYMELIAWAFILLFLYTSFSKIFLFRIYLYDLHRSPFIGPYVNIVSVLVPLSEIVISIMLFLPTTRTKGLYGSLFLMLLFTIYVAGVLSLTTERPCTCGGLIREMSWINHFIFNIFYTGLSVVGIWLDKKLTAYHISSQK